MIGIVCNIVYVLIPFQLFWENRHEAKAPFTLEHINWDMKIILNNDDIINWDIDGWFKKMWFKLKTNILIFFLSLNQTPAAKCNRERTLLGEE